MSLTTNAGNQVREKMCSILKEDWDKLGIKVNYRPLDFRPLVEKLYTTFDWDAVLIGFTGGIEPNNGANLLRSSGNLHFWNPEPAGAGDAWEAEIDRLLDEGARELDPRRSAAALLAHPGDPARAAADDPDRAAAASSPTRTRSRTTARPCGASTARS